MKLVHTERGMLGLLIVCMVTSALLLYGVHLSLKKELASEFKGIQFILDSSNDVRATLFYSESRTFSASSVLKDLNPSPDTLLFLFDGSQGRVKRLRLDFEEPAITDPLKILQMQLLFAKRTVSFSQDEVFDSFYKNSGSLLLDKNRKLLRFDHKSDPFDPYIIFSPLAELAMPGKTYIMALLTPFLLFILVFIGGIRRNKDLSFLDILVLLFIISIPLKIAWTSFCALMLCAYGLGYALYHKRLERNRAISWLFVSFFVIILLFGRPAHISLLEKELSLLLYALLAATLAFTPGKVFKYYTFVIFLLNTLVVVAGAVFLIWLYDFYGLGTTDYFSEIKIYGGEIRKWLPYDHAAFLSFFGLIGVLFVHEVTEHMNLKRTWRYLYHALLVLFIILVGTRICLVIYLVYLLNTIFRWPYKKTILINSILFILFAAGIFMGIQKFDANRTKLWAVSWEAIKAHPYLGYGLDQSKLVLQTQSSGMELPIDINHSHNQFLTFFLEIGFVGFGLLGATLFIYLYITKQYRNKTLLLFLFGLAYIFLTESILLTSKPLYVLGFLFVIISHHGRIEKT